MIIERKIWITFFASVPTLLHYFILSPILWATGSAVWMKTAAAIWVLVISWFIFSLSIIWGPNNE